MDVDQLLIQCNCWKKEKCGFLVLQYTGGGSSRYGSGKPGYSEVLTKCEGKGPLLLERYVGLRERVVSRPSS